MYSSCASTSFDPASLTGAARAGTCRPGSYADAVATAGATDETVAGRPWPSDRRRLLGVEAGCLYDTHLRRLAHVSGAVDRTIAVGLSRLRSARAYVPLGFARFDDYARERIGLAARTAHEMARLGKQLQCLPRLDRALIGGRVTWTAAALVARVATEETEAWWIELARTHTVRGLSARVRRVLDGDADEPDRHTGGEASASPGSDQPDDVAGETDADVADDTGARRTHAIHVRVPAETAVLWDAAAELCGLVAGAPLSAVETTECMFADYLSGAGGPLPQAPSDMPGNAVSRAGGPTSRRARRPARERGSVCPAPEFPLSPESRRLLDVLDRPLPDEPHGIDGALVELIRGRSTVEVDLARLLRVFRQLGLHRHLGIPGFTEYVRERLHISESRARFLVRLDRAVATSDLLTAAARSGAIGLVAAATVGRIVREVPGDDRLASAWIARARERSALRLQEEVDWVCRESLRWGDVTLDPPPPGRLPSALEALTAALGSRGDSASHVDDGGRADEGESVRGASDRAADESPDRQMFARRAGGEVTLRLWVTDDTWVEWRRSAAACEAAGRGDTDAALLREVALAFLQTHLPSWWEHVDSGDRIAVRDRFRCQIPGCSSRCGSAHHIRFRSRGGPDEDWNLVFVCPTHHLDGIHRGHVRVSGRAPDELTFGLGIRADGTALLRFRGQRRVA